MPTNWLRCFKIFFPGDPVRTPQITRQYVDCRFGQAHLLRTGDEFRASCIPLLCFHMTPLAADSFTPLLSRLGSERLTIAVDTPGYGNSCAPPTPPSIADYAIAISEVVDSLQLESIDVLGNHTGSKIALELARQRPALVRRLILMGLSVTTEEEKAARVARATPHPLSDDGTHVSGMWMRSVSLAMKGSTLRSIDRVFYLRTLHYTTAHWGHLAAARYDTRAALRAVDKPILLLRLQDGLWDITPRAVPYLRNPASTMIDKPGWSYGALDVKTSEIAAIVREFLDT